MNYPILESQAPSLFLSASIPDPTRQATLGEKPERERITNAVLALVCVCQRFGLRLCFGGHPAISPLVDHAATAYKNRDQIAIYQSKWFENQLPPAAKAFPNLIWTEIAGDLPRSLQVMRDSMLAPKVWPHLAAVCIGGMDGIMTEAGIFAQQYPTRPIIALAETGGVTRRIRELLPNIPQDRWIIPAAEANSRSLPGYEFLLRDLLGPLVPPQALRNIPGTQGSSHSPAADSFLRDRITSPLPPPTRPAVAVPASTGLGPAPAGADRYFRLNRLAFQNTRVAALGENELRLDPAQPLSILRNGNSLSARFPATNYTPDHFPAGLLLIEAIDPLASPPKVVVHRLMAIQPFPTSDKPTEFRGEIDLERWTSCRLAPLPTDFSGDFRSQFITADTPDLRSLIAPEELQRYRNTISHNPNLLRGLERLTAHLDSAGS